MNCTKLGDPCGHRPWYEFHECAEAPYAFVFYFAVKVFNLVLGTPCNVLVMWHINSKKSDASTSDIFIFNLAVLDAYFCLMTPVELLNRVQMDDYRIWYFARFAYGIKDVAPLFLMCICLDRYVAVVHPMLFTGIRDNKIRIGISVVVWALILAHGLVKSVFGVMSVNEVFSSVIMIAFIVMVFCNLSVIWVLRRSVAGKEEMHPVKKKALKMVLIILAIIVASYLPVFFMPFVSYYSFVVFQCQISIAVYSIMDLSCSVEPLVYLVKMERVSVSCCRRKSAKTLHDPKA
ncbi:P2Y purinoceptor 1-like [Betta splendens]|uniref:P2Y purinoceptor 1-like n=1 Tax=Betta splendens TaxID=158456 RepID=A0A6P7P2J1_BETSP|nr:P2Y purinoceptor 1-like [Betta splendens]